MMHVFCINPNRLGTDSYEKIEHLKRQIKSQQIDVCMLSSPNRKLNKYSESIIRTKLQIGVNKTILIVTDSRGVKKKKGEWLPGGTLSIFSSKWANYIEQVHKDKYG